MGEKKDAFIEGLTEGADVVIHGVAHPGALSLTESLKVRDWWDANRKGGPAAHEGGGTDG